MKAKVYKEGRWWVWEHPCPYRPHSAPFQGYLHKSWQTAFTAALRHARRCL